MKKLILSLGIIALGFTVMQSCSKKDKCVCTDANGVAETIDLSSQPSKAARKLTCDNAHTTWAMMGGNCKLN